MLVAPSFPVFEDLPWRERPAGNRGVVGRDASARLRRVVKTGRAGFAYGTIVE
jgi:hypothetical protein